MGKTGDFEGNIDQERFHTFVLVSREYTKTKVLSRVDNIDGSWKM